MESLEQILAESSFLHGLQQHHLELITGCASNVRFDGGQYLFREGEEAEKFYILRHGRVSLEIFTPDRGPITIQTLETGGRSACSGRFFLKSARTTLCDQARPPFLP